MSNTIFTYPLRNADAVDGDSVRVTLDLGFNLSLLMNCRILGVDAPEKNTLAGKLVKSVVGKWLYSHATISTYSYSWDKYGGRYDGEILGGEQGHFLSAYLLNAKVAVPYDGKSPRHLWSQEELAEVVRRAEAILDAP